MAESKEPTTSQIGSLSFNGITFASADAVQTSIRTFQAKTESYTIADRMSKMKDFIAIPSLTPQTFQSWCAAIRQALVITQSSASLLPEDAYDETAASFMWRSYWVQKLKESAPSSYKVCTNSPRKLMQDLTTTVGAGTARVKGQITSDLFSIGPSTTLAGLLSQMDTHLGRYDEQFTLGKEGKGILQVILCHRIASHNEDLAIRCRTLDLDGTIAQLRLHTNTTTNSSNTKHPGWKSNEWCSYHKAKGHSTADCKARQKGMDKSKKDKDKKDKTANISAVTKVPTPPGKSYMLDSGADNHVAGNKTDFSSYVTGPALCQLANGSTAQILGRGELLVPTLNGHLHLTDCIHMAGVQNTILSLAKLEDKGMYLHCPAETSLSKELRRPDHSVVLTFQRVNNKYLWRPPQSSSSTDWHAALGHVNPRTVKQTLHRHEIIPSELPTTQTCLPCAQAKFHATPGSGKLVSEAKAFLDVFHMDLVGGKDSLPPSTKLGDCPAATMALVVIDESTRFKWVFPLHAKTDAPIQLKGLLLHLHSRFHRFPFRIHTDRGSEFINGTLNDFLVDKGIRWTASSAQAHQQNGLIERTNRTIFESLRASHIHANIPAKVWATTIIATVDTLNNTATVINKAAPAGPGNKAPAPSKISPYELVYNKLPDLCSLPLGCQVLFRKDEAKPLPKLSPKTVEGVFLGKVDNVAHILDLKTNRVITRRDFTPFPATFPLRPRISTLTSGISSSDVPVSAALSGPDREDWYQAMHKEAQQMHDMGVWQLVPKDSLPPNAKVMTGTWALRMKPDGTKKARWCARGFSEPNVDNVYADVLQAVTMRMVFAYAAQKNYDIRHIDISGAFLNAELDSPLYLQQPRHITRGYQPGMVCRLQKAIYGLRTAPRRWQEELTNTLLKLGFSQLRHDSNLFRRGELLLSVYVDDFKLVGPSLDIDKAISELKEKYRLRDLGLITSYLGMEITRTSKGYQISQTAKINKVLHDLDLQNNRPISVPIPDDNRLDLEPEDFLSESSATLYRSAVGQLLHISMLTRPDISYAVMRLTRRMAKPTRNALHALKALGKYLLKTSKLPLHFQRSESIILGSSDSSWGTVSNSKATTGNVFLLNGAPIAWKAKRQTLTAQSTCEAEYIAASTAATQARWLVPLFNEIWKSCHDPIVLQMDNQAAIATAQKGGVSARNRHFLIRQSVLREALEDKLITIRYTPTSEVIADGFTKALQRVKHDSFLHLLQMSDHPAQTCT